MLVWSSITYWLLSCFACAVVNNVPDRKMHLRPCQHMQWPWPLKNHFQPSLLLLSHFSCVWLWTTPSLGLSRQEHWSGLPFPSPMHKSEKWKWSLSVMSDSSRPHGLQLTRLLHQWIFQARILGWGAIAFSIQPSLPSAIDLKQNDGVPLSPQTDKKQTLLFWLQKEIRNISRAFPDGDPVKRTWRLYFDLRESREQL